jgi:trigger factor
MEFTETKADGLKREYKIAVPAADIEADISGRLQELARTVKMPGFRPGKVPVTLLRKKYGASVMGEMLERMVNESSSKVMSEQDLRPAVKPKIEVTSFEEGADLEFTMAVELMPVVEDLDFSKIKLTRLVVEVDEGEIDKTLERVAESHKTSEPVAAKRKAKTGDILIIDFNGRVNDVEFTGGKAEDYSLELGSGSFIPGFEDQLIGAKAGDTVDVKVTFPDDYGASELAGNEAVFEVTVKELHEARPAPIDDTLAEKLGAKNLSDLKKGIRQEHEREFKELSRLRLKRSLLDHLADTYKFDIPEGLLENEFDAIWTQYQERLEAGEEEPEKGKSDDDLKSEFRAICERRVRLGIVLAQVGQDNNIQVSQEETNRAIQASANPGQEKAIMDYYRDNAQALDAVRAPIFEDKVVDFIIEMATVSEKKVSLDELLKEPDDKPAKKPARKKAAGKKSGKGTKKKS